MADYTGSLKLKLPLGSKYWNYDTHNENMQKLDIGHTNIKRDRELPRFSASDVTSTTGNLQNNIDALASTHHDGAFNVRAVNDVTLQIPNYTNCHITLTIPQATVPKIRFEKSIPNEGEFKIQGGKYMGINDQFTTFDQWTSPAWTCFKLGDVYYYRYSGNTPAVTGALTIQRASDPFYQNIIGEEIITVEATQSGEHGIYNYIDPDSGVPAFIFDRWYNTYQGRWYMDVRIGINSLNYGWYPNFVGNSTYELDFDDLNMIWIKR